MTPLDRSVPPRQRSEEWYAVVPTSDEVVNDRRRTWSHGLDDTWFGGSVDSTWFHDGHIIADHPALPSWIRHANGVLNTAPLEDRFLDEGLPEHRATAAMLSPVVAYAASLLDGMCADHPVAITHGARMDMLRGLHRRAIMTLASVVADELAAWKATCTALGMPASTPYAADETTWPDMVERLPMLAHVTGTLVTHWLEYVAELLSRLASDAEDLVELWPGTGVPAELLRVSLDAGDLHDHGRSVALMTFDGDRRCAYKPKDLRIVERTLDLFERLNAAADEPLLHIRPMVLRPGYAWEGFVTTAPCMSLDDVALYYERFGAMVCMYEHLEARDLWLDNVVASASWPAVIDMEMVLQPRMSADAGIDTAERYAQHMLDESSLSTGLVVMSFPVGEGRPAEDMGALTPLRPFRTPFKARAELTGEVETGSDGHVTFEHPDYVPVFDGLHVDVRRWHDHVERGYARMDDLLAGSLHAVVHEWVLDVDPDIPVRSIHRDTWTCQRILQASTTSAALRSAWDRDASLNRLVKVATGTTKPGSVEHAVILSEIQQLRILDIPYFLTPVGDSGVRTSEGSLLGTVYDGAPLRRCIERVEHPIDPEFRRDVLRASIAIGAGGREDRPVMVDGAVEAFDPVEIIHTVARRLVDLAIRRDGRYAWIGAVHHAMLATTSIEVLRPTLLGSLGIAVALHEARAVADIGDADAIISCVTQQATREMTSANAIMRSGVALPAWVQDPLEGLPALEHGLAILTDGRYGRTRSFPMPDFDLADRVAIFAEHGRWFPERQLPERFDLSALNGLAAIVRLAVAASVRNERVTI